GANVGGRWNRRRQPGHPEAPRGLPASARGAADRRDAEWARQCNDQIGSPGMPPRNAGADYCHAITAPSSARFEAKRAAQADGVRDPVFVVPNAFSAVLPAIEQRSTMSEAS